MRSYPLADRFICFTGFIETNINSQDAVMSQKLKLAAVLFVWSFLVWFLVFGTLLWFKTQSYQALTLTAVVGVLLGFLVVFNFWTKN
jgi:hypothetical protein